MIISIDFIILLISMFLVNELFSSCLLIMYNGSSKLYLTMFLPFAIVNFILDLLPAFVLRYNLNRLQILYKFNLKHQKEGN